MKLAIGNDHSAVEMKKEIKKYLEDKGIAASQAEIRRLTSVPTALRASTTPSAVTRWARWWPTAKWTAVC